MDVKKNCAAVMSRVIFIGFCVQIALGMFWMCNAFAGMHDFGKGIVCVVQILLLGAVLWFLMPKATVPQSLFRVLAVESFPMILQLLTKPDLRILVVLILLLGWKACRNRIPVTCLCVILGLGVGAVLIVRADLPALCGSRIVWTTLYRDYYALEDEAKDKIDYWVMVDSTLDASGVETILVPDLREKYSEEEVRVLMGALRDAAWKGHKKQIVKEILWDEAGYVLPPVVLLLQLQHRAYDSYAGLNYRQFLQVSPIWGKYAMRYGCCWFALALIFRLLLVLLEDGRGCHASALLYAIFTTVVMSAWYTFSTTGKMDYKNVIYILCLWLFWMTEGATFWKKEAASDAAYTEEK